jgi:hypothetical protein
MKYHGLKMEEVNDTMRHLWNKTYQGTGVSGPLVPLSIVEITYVKISMASKSVRMSKGAVQNDPTIIGYELFFLHPTLKSLMSRRL